MRRPSSGAYPDSKESPSIGKGFNSAPFSGHFIVHRSERRDEVRRNAASFGSNYHKSSLQSESRGTYHGPLNSPTSWPYPAARAASTGGVDAACRRSRRPLAGEGSLIPKRFNGIANEHNPTLRAGLQYRVNKGLVPFNGMLIE
jgi:hypothetical protein